LLSSWRENENSIHPKAVGEFIKGCCCKYMLHSAFWVTG
jgi:hypothetical protein